MNGYGQFTHRIHVNWIDDFLYVRGWFFENFEIGCELEFFKGNNFGYTWAWASDYNRREIYLNEDQLSAFILFTA